MVRTCKSSALEVGAGRSEVQGHLCLCSELDCSQGYVLKTLSPKAKQKYTFCHLIFQTWFSHWSQTTETPCPPVFQPQALESSPVHLLAAIMYIFPDSPACPDPQGLAYSALPTLISTALSHFQSLGHGALHPCLVHASSHLCLRYPKSLFFSCASGHLCRLHKVTAIPPHQGLLACSSPVHSRHHPVLSPPDSSLSCSLSLNCFSTCSKGDTDFWANPYPMPLGPYASSTSLCPVINI